MKNIKLNSTSYKSADNIIKEIEKRAKKQSRLYTTLFIVISIAISMFVLDSLSVEEYDGYISHQDIKVRAIDNVAIVDYFVKPGDIVNEGDTLYSCLRVDWLESQVNPFSDNIGDDKKIESDLRVAKYESEIVEINNTIYSLHTALNNIKEEIQSGVKTEDELVSLELELSDRIERSKHLRRAIRAEYEMQSKYDYEISNYTSLVTQSQSERRANFEQYGNALTYRVAYVDAKIINVRASVGVLTLEHEEVLTFQPIGHPDMTNSHIEMIVEANKYEEIEAGMEVDVYAGGEFLCVANVSFLGVRMADAYANIELLLDRSTDINGKLIVSLKFKDGYQLPEKYFIHNYPVEIRHRVWGRWSRYLNWNNWLN